jgi:hypothetical protein
MIVNMEQYPSIAQFYAGNVPQQQQQQQQSQPLIKCAQLKAATMADY